MVTKRESSKPKSEGVPSSSPSPAEAGVAPQAPVSAGSSTKERKGKKVAIRAGGHVVYVDPPPETPKREPTCSVHGQNCPGHEETSGWQIEKKG